MENQNSLLGSIMEVQLRKLLSILKMLFLPRWINLEDY